MRRRSRPAKPVIPSTVMDEHGRYAADWAAWCEANGFKKVEFLRIAERRRHSERPAEGYGE